MKYYQKALYDEMITLYKVTTDGKDAGRIRGIMGSLVRKARTAISADADEKLKIHRLLQLFYGDWGFHCDPDHYFELQNLYLNHVLETREGMPVSLGAILLYLADSLNLAIYPIDFPTQLILRAGVGDDVAFIDPWNGHYVTPQYLQKLYEGAFGFGAKLYTENLEPAKIPDLLAHFNQLAKNALIREEHNDEAFRFINGLLHLHPDDPYEIRDRGLVLAQMGAYHAAAEDLQYFVEQCPQDPTSMLLSAQMAELKQASYDLH